MTTPGSNSSSYERVFSDVKIALIEDFPFHTHCVHCGKVGWTKSTLKLCARCKCAAYCSRECQVADYNNHKMGCKEISKHKEVMEENGAALYHMDDSMSSILDFFRSCLLQRMMPKPILAYLKGRLELVQSLRQESRSQCHALGRINEVALATYLEHLMDLLTLPVPGTKLFPPPFVGGLAGVMIAVGKHQQAYDFLKFCLSNSGCRQYPGYDTPPLLQPKDENMLEPLELLQLSPICNLCQVLEMALLKLCIFSNARGAQFFAKKFGFNHDIVSIVGSYLHAPDNWQEIDARSLLFQARQLLSLAHSKNRHVLTAMIFMKTSTLSTPFNDINKARSVTTSIGRWWRENKVAKNFLVNFDRNIEKLL